MQALPFCTICTCSCCVTLSRCHPPSRQTMLHVQNVSAAAPPRRVSVRREAPGDADGGTDAQATRWEECSSCRRFVPVVTADGPDGRSASCSECGGSVEVRAGVPLDCWVQCELCGKARARAAR